MIASSVRNSPKLSRIALGWRCLGANGTSADRAFLSLSTKTKKSPTKWQLTNPSRFSPLYIMSYPGSRVLELSNSEEGNYITEALLISLHRKLESFIGNPIVTAVVFTSDSQSLFSLGVESTVGQVSKVQSINNFAAYLDKYRHPITIAVFSGEVNSAAFATFASSEFRLGTETTCFQINDLTSSTAPRLPLGGALAFHLVRQIGLQESSSNYGVGCSIARYLAVTGRRVDAQQLYEWGLLTHIVEKDAQHSLCQALGQTVPPDDFVKAVQPSAADETTIKRILNDMNYFIAKPSVNAKSNMNNNSKSKDSIRVVQAAREEVEFDQALWEAVGNRGILNHAVWDKLMVVPPQQFTEQDLRKVRAEERQMSVQPNCMDSGDDTFSEMLYGEYHMTNVNVEEDEDIDEILDVIQHCFGVDNLGECKRRLLKYHDDNRAAGAWVNAALRRMESIPTGLIEDWFELTRIAKLKTTSISHILMVEKELAAKYDQST